MQLIPVGSVLVGRLAVVVVISGEREGELVLTYAEGVCMMES